MSGSEISYLADVAVLDSNVWVFGLTRNQGRCEALISRLLINGRPIHVSAYIFDEVFEAFDRSLEGSAVDEAKQKFAEFVASHDGVHGPTQHELREMDLVEVRNQPEMQMMGRALGIQPKDVPILVLAWQHREGSTAIYTEDGPFAEFEPADYNMPEIDIGQWRKPK